MYNKIVSQKQKKHIKRKIIKSKGRPFIFNFEGRTFEIKEIK